VPTAALCSAERSTRALFHLFPLDQQGVCLFVLKEEENEKYIYKKLKPRLFLLF
jgi:hypothetical protein